MSGQQVDSAMLFHALLSGSAGITTLVTNTVGNDVIVDIYGPPGIPAGWTIRNAVEFAGDGGPGDINIPIGRESFAVNCYARSSPEARQVYMAVRAALHRKRHQRLVIDGQTYLFQYAQLMGGPADRVDPVDGWNFVYCSFMVHFGEVTV